MMYQSHLSVLIYSPRIIFLIIFIPPRLRRRRQDEAWHDEALYLQKTSQRREYFFKNNGHWALQVWCTWGRRKCIATRSKIIYRSATNETTRTKTETNGGMTTKHYIYKKNSPVLEFFF